MMLKIDIVQNSRIKNNNLLNNNRGLIHTKVIELIEHKLNIVHVVGNQLILNFKKHYMQLNAMNNLNRKLIFLIYKIFNH